MSLVWATGRANAEDEYQDAGFRSGEFGMTTSNSTCGSGAQEVWVGT